MTNTLAAIASIALAVVDGAPTTTSNEVASHFGKQHKHVLDTIAGLLAQLPETYQPNFRPADYIDAKGESRPAYRITRDGFTLLAMGFTGKRALQFKLAYIDAFNRMEDALRNPVPAPAISLEQQQTIKELVEIAHQGTGQTYGEIYSRLHHHFKVPRYSDLRPEQFQDACQYLQGKLDGNMMGKLILKHLGTPRVLMSIDHNGNTTAQIVPDDAYIFTPAHMLRSIEQGALNATFVQQIAKAALGRLTNGAI